MGMRIGLYGGSFDPVHLGHLLVAQAAREEMALDRVVFIPAMQSPFKPGRQLTAPTIRLQLLHLALAGRTFCEIDGQEIERAGISYTIDTVRAYQNRHPNAELFYLIGADHVSQLSKWREAAALAETVEFIVIPRPGEPQQPLPPGFRGRNLQGFPFSVSSSQIRDRVARGLPVELLTTTAVAQAIGSHRLYVRSSEMS
jgi:nicotinate-nucleotide adenylyltransferase